jgi:hypothetical protein
LLKLTASGNVQDSHLIPFSFRRGGNHLRGKSRGIFPVFFLCLPGTKVYAVSGFMKREIPYHRLWILPAMILAFIIQAACDRTGPGAADTRDTAVKPADTLRPEIPKPAADATIIDSLTHDFGGVWAADSAGAATVSSSAEGLMSFCRNGNLQYRVFRDGPTLFFTAKQVWIDRQHVHVDMFLSHIDAGSAALPDSIMPQPGKLFATADLRSSSRMNVLWYARDLVSAVRTMGGAGSPEAFPAYFYYTQLPAVCK